MDNVLPFRAALSLTPRVTSASKVEQTLQRAKELKQIREDVTDLKRLSLGKGDPVTVNGKRGCFIGWRRDSDDLAVVFVEGDIYAVPHDKVDPARPEHFA